MSSSVFMSGYGGLAHLRDAGDLAAIADSSLSFKELQELIERAYHFHTRSRGSERSSGWLA